MTLKDNNNNNDKIPKDLKESTIYSGKWLSFSTIEFRHPKNELDVRWEFVQRNTIRSDGVDAVDVIAILKSDGVGDKLILVSQFRPPIKKYALEFPAGLIDAGETAETCALRELKEETGYIGTVLGTSSIPAVYDPGMSNSCMRSVMVEVDASKPENINPTPNLDSDEWSLETVVLPLENLINELKRLHEEKDYCIDGRLYSFAIGLHISKNFQF